MFSCILDKKSWSLLLNPLSSFSFYTVTCFCLQAVYLTCHICQIFKALLQRLNSLQSTASLSFLSLLCSSSFYSYFSLSSLRMIVCLQKLSKYFLRIRLYLFIVNLASNCLTLSQPYLILWKADLTRCLSIWASVPTTLLANSLNLNNIYSASSFDETGLVCFCYWLIWDLRLVILALVFGIIMGYTGVFFDFYTVGGTCKGFLIILKMS